MSDLTMRRRILHFSSTLFVQIFREGLHNPYEVIKDALPKDAKIIDVKVKHFSPMEGHATIEFLIESKEFKKIEDGEKYPDIIPTLKKIDPSERLKEGENG